MKVNFKCANKFNQIGMSRLTIKRSSETKKEEKMRSKIKSILIVIVALFAICAMAGPAMAADNTAVDGGGAIGLTSSGVVTVNSSSLQLVKAIFDASGNCLASNPTHADCNTVSTISVPTGTELTFVIYVNNATGATASDVRFTDNIDDVDGGDGLFAFQADEYAVGEGIMWANTGSGTSTPDQVKTAVDAGTSLTNDNTDGGTAGEYAGIDTTVSPDVLTVGGTGAGNNAAVSIAADETFAIKFNVIKQ